MKTLHLKKQNEIHLLPVYDGLSESELDIIASEHGIGNYEVVIKEQHSCEENKQKFQCYIYVMKY